MSILLLYLGDYRPWWVIGLVIIALLLLVLGRLGARASVAGQLPDDEGPDLKATGKGQEPDIRPEDESQGPSPHV